MKICPKCGDSSPNSYLKCSCGEDIKNVVPEEQKPMSPNADSSRTGVFSAIYIFGIIAAVFSFIFSISQLDNIFIGIVLGISFLIFSALIYGVKRIIDLLSEISNKLDNYFKR